MFDAVEDFYRKFFFRPRKIAGIVGEMLSDWNQLKVRLGEARDFFHFLEGLVRNLHVSIDAIQVFKQALVRPIVQGKQRVLHGFNCLSV